MISTVLLAVVVAATQGSLFLSDVSQGRSPFGRGLSEVGSETFVQSGKRDVSINEKGDGPTGDDGRKNGVLLNDSNVIGKLVAVNHASASELTELPGIGPAKAARIIDARQARTFRSVNDLLRVKGLGPKTIKKLAPLIVID